MGRETVSNLIRSSLQFVAIGPIRYDRRILEKALHGQQPPSDGGIIDGGIRSPVINFACVNRETTGTICSPSYI